MRNSGEEAAAGGLLIFSSGVIFCFLFCTGKTKCIVPRLALKILALARDDKFLDLSLHQVNRDSKAACAFQTTVRAGPGLKGWIPGTMSSSGGDVGFGRLEPAEKLSGAAILMI